LASGSDHGCSSIIIWDTSDWSIISKMQNHSAAVTSIVDLGDGQTIISGSYDKKINIYNYKTSTLIESVKENKSSVFSLVLNSSKTKLVAGVLDNGMNGMYIYGIKYDSNGVF
jgi:WD40 repeat protein